MNILKKQSTLLALSITAIVLMAVFIIGIIVTAWPYIQAKRTLAKLVDPDNRVASLINVITDDSLSYNVRILAIEDAGKLVSDLQDSQLAVDVMTASLSMITNTAYFPLIKERARSKGLDPDEHLTTMQDLAFLVRGYSYYDLGQYSNACNDLLSIQQPSDPIFSQYHEFAGEAAFRDGRWSQAAEHLAICQQAHPNNPTYSHMLGMASLHNHDYPMAASNLTHTINLDTNDLDAAWYLSLLYSSSDEPAMHDGQRALDVINQGFASTTNPSSNLYDAKACALARLGRFEESVACIQQAIETEQADQNDAAYLEHLAMKLKKFQQSEPWSIDQL